jgi:hypothetical protein
MKPIAEVFEDFSAIMAKDCLQKAEPVRCTVKCKAGEFCFCKPWVPEARKADS